MTLTDQQVQEEVAQPVVTQPKVVGTIPIEALQALMGGKTMAATTVGDPAPPAAVTTALPLGFLRGIFSFLGEANTQKAIALAFSYLSATGHLNGASLGKEIGGATLGGAYALGVHVVDAVRAAIAKR